MPSALMTDTTLIGNWPAFCYNGLPFCPFLLSCHNATTARKKMPSVCYDKEGNLRKQDRTITETFPFDHHLHVATMGSVILVSVTAGWKKKGTPGQRRRHHTASIWLALASRGSTLPRPAGDSNGHLNCLQERTSPHLFFDISKLPVPTVRWFQKISVLQI